MDKGFGGHYSVDKDFGGHYSVDKDFGGQCPPYVYFKHQILGYKQTNYSRSLFLVQL